MRALCPGFYHTSFLLCLSATLLTPTILVAPCFIYRQAVQENMLNSLIFPACIHSARPQSRVTFLFAQKRGIVEGQFFPVRIYITNELSSLLSPAWSFTILLFGFGSSLYSSRPRLSLLHLSFHSADVLLPKIVAFAETSSFTSGVCAAVPVASFCRLIGQLVASNTHMCWYPVKLNYITIFSQPFNFLHNSLHYVLA